MGKDRLGRGAEEGDLAFRSYSLYGRRVGRPLRQLRQELLETLLPALQIDVPENGTFDPRALFDSDVQQVWLEIGAGNGEHAAWQAAQNPSVGYMAVEPFVNGVASLLAMVEERGLTNVRVLMGDVRPLLEVLAADSIDRSFVLFPDPWPKRRHWRRRIISPGVIDHLAHAMKPGTDLRVGTDDVAYLVWILRLLRANPDFRWQAQAADDWRIQPEDWPETKFEARGRDAGRPSTYLSLRRT